MPTQATSVQSVIEQKLSAEFEPITLLVENESHQHNVPPGSESHFKVTLVSDHFDPLRKVARHQRVYAALSEELAGPVHALALHTYTATEWQELSGGAAPDSPNCLGGSNAG